MDRDVTIRFYEICSVDEGQLPIETAMTRLAVLPKLEREATVSGPIRLRLEHLDFEDGLYLGDVTRVQAENLPGHVTEEATDPLPVDRIGHSAAFCYDPETRCLALQFDVKIGVGRVCGYFSQFADGARFGHLPVLRPDALERFAAETPTSLTVRVARRRNFQDAQIPLTDFEEQIDQMGALFEAPSVEVTVSCRAADGGLRRESVLHAVRRWLAWRDEISGIRVIKGTTVESDEAYNFIKHLLKEQATLELPDNSPAEGRAIRLRHLRATYAQHRAYLRATSGA